MFKGEVAGLHIRRLGQSLIPGSLLARPMLVLALESRGYLGNHRGAFS